MASKFKQRISQINREMQERDDIDKDNMTTANITNKVVNVSTCTILNEQETESESEIDTFDINWDQYYRQLWIINMLNDREQSDDDGYLNVVTSDAVVNEPGVISVTPEELANARELLNSVYRDKSKTRQRSDIKDNQTKKQKQKKRMKKRNQHDDIELTDTDTKYKRKNSKEKSKKSKTEKAASKKDSKPKRRKIENGEKFNSKSKHSERICENDMNCTDILDYILDERVDKKIDVAIDCKMDNLLSPEDKNLDYELEFDWNHF